ncbi:hypothetical protein FAGAP_8840 [Fusarium agapanthi]|uniref:Uncharacterized protein n=1 Tax=Fusarium agapanthi TaxID=1803897 RepID=A0A9P5B424_9HYPO|nr:hypothetical protein FAGAP_8840 [Fusarium agapanthi]
MAPPMAVKDPDHGAVLKPPEDMPALSANEVCTLSSSPPDDEEEVYEKQSGHEGSVYERKPSLPTCLLLRNREHTERFMVMPTRDLFCIKNLSNPQLPVTLEGARLQVQCPNDQKITLRHSFNLVLEFYISWNDDFPGSWDELTKEQSPRGRFAYWAQTCNRGMGNAARIYLLNKAARWGPGWWVNKNIVFHECDGAYMEVKNEYFSFYPSQPAETSAILDFLNCVWQLHKRWSIDTCDDCTKYGYCAICSQCPDWDLTRYVKVLIRHEEDAAGGQLED